MAQVEAPGPFSAFPGIDRTLTIVAGAGLRLRGADGSVIHLPAASAPYSFPGDAAIEATLLDGPTTDLNVMTRRGRCHHRVRRLLAGTVRGLAGSRAFLVAADAGPASVRVDADMVTLSPLDAVDLGTGPWRAEVLQSTPGGLLLVEIASG